MTCEKKIERRRLKDISRMFFFFFSESSHIFNRFILILFSIVISVITVRYRAFETKHNLLMTLMRM